MVILTLVLLLLIFAGAWAAWWWHDQQLWEGYLERLRAQPGIVITEAGKRDGKFVVSGMRDPLAVDRQAVLREAEVNPDRVVASWVPYQALDPQSVLKRLNAALDPPPSVTLAIAGNRIVAQGSAPRPWLEHAQAAALALPAGAPGFDLAGIRNEDEGDERRWRAYVKWLRSEPGIVITQSEARDGKFLLSGLRDPLAIDPLKLLGGAGIDPTRIQGAFRALSGARSAIGAETAQRGARSAVERDPGDRRKPHRGARFGAAAVARTRARCCAGAASRGTGIRPLGGTQ